MTAAEAVDVTRKPRMVFLATEYYFFDAMCKALAPDAVRRAFDIHVVTYCGNSGDRAKSSGFAVTDFTWRRSKSIWRAGLQFIPELIRVRHLLKTLAPDILHNIALKPAIIGSLAVRGSNARIVNTITGFGFLFYATSPLARIARAFCEAMLRRLSRAVFVVHNTTDLEFARRTLHLPDVRLIGGLGLDTDDFAPLPEPDPARPFRFLVISRLLYMKGIAVVVAALKLMHARGREAELMICGAPDADNPSSISAADIASWSQERGVRFLGQVANVRGEIAQSHVLVHPALGGEGLPRALLEAAACARPLIATDIAGNRDIVVNGENGLLVKPGEALALADAMEWMMTHPLDRARFGADGRAKVLAKFSSTHVATSYGDLYRELCPEAR